MGNPKEPPAGQIGGELGKRLRETMLANLSQYERESGENMTALKEMVLDNREVVESLPVTIPPEVTVQKVECITPAPQVQEVREFPKAKIIKGREEFAVLIELKKKRDGG